MSIPNIKARLDAERAKYGKNGQLVTADQCVAILNDAAYGTGFKLYRKPGNGGTRRDGVICSRDILGYPDPVVGMYYKDVLGSSGAGIASVNWPNDGEWEVSKPEDIGNYIDPIAPVAVPQEPPTPKPQEPPPQTPPPAPSVDLSAILARLDAIAAEQKEMASLLDAMSQDCELLVDAVSSQIQPPTPPVPPSVTFPDYRGAVPYLGTITLKPVKG